MIREFKLPDVGEGVAEGEIVRWLVEEGDAVEEDQPVAEVETDKAVVEVPSPVDGTVEGIFAEEGEVVPVGTVIITFEVEGEEAEAEAGTGAESPDPAAAGGADAGAEPGASAEEPAAGAGADPAAEPAETAGSGRVFAAPTARRLARELGVDITSVEGAGPGGRVTEADVRAAAGAQAGGEDGAGGQGPATEPATGADAEPAGEPAAGAESGPDAGAATSAVAAAEPADRERTLAAPATRRVARELEVDIDRVPAVEERDGEAFVTVEAVREYAEARRRAREAEVEAEAGAGAASVDAGVAAAEAGERVERVPYRGIRRTIGQQMERSKYTAPHVTHHDAVDVTELVGVREELKGAAEERGIRLTYLPFAMKAVVAALKEHPALNSTLDEEAGEILHRKYYNVGVATATEAGLMVPVVEAVDRKGLLQLASEVNELVEKARDRSIAREEMQGGTFTITNFGAIGGEYATPIINYPETAILGLGAIKERPWVVDGEVVPRQVVTLSLSIDHRVIDGAEAAAFTNTLKEYLEHPSLLLLE